MSVEHDVIHTIFSEVCGERYSLNHWLITHFDRLDNYQTDYCNREERLVAGFTLLLNKKEEALSYAQSLSDYRGYYFSSRIQEALDLLKDYKLDPARVIEDSIKLLRDETKHYATEDSSYKAFRPIPILNYENDGFDLMKLPLVYKAEKEKRIFEYAGKRIEW
jgi:hypothetical protein